MLDKDQDNMKALYRRGKAYTGIGEFKKAREDFKTALDLSDGKDSAVR